MTISIVECPHCHYKFNYEFIPSVSFYSLRIGTQRIFKCPNCKELHKFNVTHFGTDPMLPTHGDNSETGIGGRMWALLLAPLAALIILGYLFLLTSGYVSVFLILVAIGIIWPLAYIAYLYKKVDPANDRKAEGAI